MKYLLNCFGSVLILMAFSSSLWGYSPSQSPATLKVEEGQLGFSLEVPWSIAEGLKKNYHQVVLHDGTSMNYITDAGQPSFTIGNPVVAQASFPLLRLLFLIGPAFVILGMAYWIDKFTVI